MLHTLNAWLVHYGYGVLFAALLLEMLALPLPGEVLMSYAGLLVFEGKMNLPLSILSAGGGVTAGITLSYWIGFRLGRPFFERHGRRFHLGPDKLDRTSRWFERYGNLLLLIAFYIPGIRHFTGYFSGVTRMAYARYAAFSYTGAFVWTGVFITLGSLLGPKWEHYHHIVNRVLAAAFIAAAIAALLVYGIRRSGRRRNAGVPEPAERVRPK
ncbi:DedA family protein [Paenibacillus humicola]|uniref:DedA family protein n=1 Tax=Paenibacillus humicola TaxID=3110540 RepID=UPI00237AEFC9|nr:DedA family protein [Paenibacillus humicola]